MTRILLDVPHDKDLNLILTLLDRLDVCVITKNSMPHQPIPIEDDVAFFMKGVPKREDLDDFLRDFEANRGDRPLSGQES